MDKNSFIERIMGQAENEMKKLNHPYVGTEHLLLALLKIKEIREVVNDYDLSYESFYNELISTIGISNILSNTILKTPLLKSVIKDAKSDAINNNNGIVTGKHLLISILESGDGIAVRLLLNMGIDLQSMYKDLKKDYDILDNELYNYGKNLFNSDTILLSRDSELEEIVGILTRKSKNNPLLIGEAGVGKTAIVEGLSTNIKNNKYPKLSGYEIISIDMSSVLAGTKYRGDFEERLNSIIKETLKRKNIILFIDEIHTIVNAGGSEGAIDASNILKPYLSKSDLKIIGATTIDEYNKYFLKDKALLRRFDVVNICEPNINMTKDILLKLKDNYVNYHSVKISEKNINDIIALTDKYLKDRRNPDKSIDILDSVCSYISNCDRKVISKDDIMYIIERKTKRKFKYNNNLILSNLKTIVFGQDQPISRIIDIINSNDSFITILLMGGIGVGKTTVVNEISKELGMNFISFDNSDFLNINNLENKINDNSIILFDNIEKYNKASFDILKHIINTKSFMNKKIANSIIFLSVTNLVKYNIGYNNSFIKEDFRNDILLDSVDYYVRFNEVNEDAVKEYIKSKKVENFDITKCDYNLYGFRGVKISMNSCK